MKEYVLGMYSFFHYEVYEVIGRWISIIGMY